MSLKLLQVKVHLHTMNLPKPSARNVTGSGPFIELPLVKSLGSSGALYSAVLPANSALNIKSNSVVSSTCTSDPSLECQVFPLTKSLWYQKIGSREKNFITISGGETERHSQSLIEVRKGKDWDIWEPNSLASWAGYDLQVIPFDSKTVIKGNGFVLIKGSGALRSLRLGTGEKVLINSQNLVASSVTFTTEAFKMKSNRSLGLMNTKVLSKIKLFLAYITKPIEGVTKTYGITSFFSKISQRFHKSSLATRLTQMLVKSKSSELYVACGPGDLVIQSVQR